MSANYEGVAAEDFENEGDFWFSKCDYEQALRLYKKAEQILKSKFNDKDSSFLNISWKAGMSSYFTSNIADALVYLKQYISIIKHSGSSKEQKSQAFYVLFREAYKSKICDKTLWYLIRFLENTYDEEVGEIYQTLKQLKKELTLDNILNLFNFIFKQEKKNVEQLFTLLRTIISKFDSIEIHLIFKLLVPNCTDHKYENANPLLVYCYKNAIGLFLDSFDDKNYLSIELINEHLKKKILEIKAIVCSVENTIIKKIGLTDEFDKWITGLDQERHMFLKKFKLEEFNRIVSINPKNSAELLAIVGYCCKFSDNLGNAKKYYVKATEYEYFSKDFVWMKADILFACEVYIPALEFYGEVVDQGYINKLENRQKWMI